MNKTKKLIIERIKSIKKPDSDTFDKYYQGWNEGLDEAIELIKASSEIE